jgi:hypothetical protein
MERYKCKFCDNTYASMSSRSNHIKRLHMVNSNIKQTDNSNTKQTNSNINHQMNKKNIDDMIKCNYCNKCFTTTQSKYRHMKHFCKENIKDNTPLDI